LLLGHYFRSVNMSQISIQSHLLELLEKSLIREEYICGTGLDDFKQWLWPSMCVVKQWERLLPIQNYRFSRKYPPKISVVI